MWSSRSFALCVAFLNWDVVSLRIVRCGHYLLCFGMQEACFYFIHCLFADDWWYAMQLTLVRLMLKMPTRLTRKPEGLTDRLGNCTSRHIAAESSPGPSVLAPHSGQRKSRLTSPASMNEWIEFCSFCTTMPFAIATTKGIIARSGCHYCKKILIRYPYWKQYCRTTAATWYNLP